MPGCVSVGGAKPGFEKAPVARRRQLHQRMLRVQDLIQPCAKQVLMASLTPLPWPKPE